jgi:tRNA threonylcarbamoyl adenosine modification protein (Sua5/YciO/YrdC/YwlC family)
MILNIHPENPQGRKIDQAIEALQKDGVIIYPTDTVYGLGCSIFSKKGVERICRLRGLDPQKAQLSFICESISQVAEYAAQIDNEVFRLMKQLLPGPYTFILKASNQVPKLIQSRRATIGVRVPENNIPLEIVRALGHPILTTSLKNDDEILEYYTEVADFAPEFENLVDIIIDGGSGGNVASTIINCTVSPPELIREGAGPVHYE